MGLKVSPRTSTSGSRILAPSLAPPVSSPAPILLSASWGSVSVRRDRGAKITAITLANGHEWLVQADHEGGGCDADAEFIDAEVCGWDEIAPTLTSPGVRDHGEVWHGPWALLHLDERRLVLETRGERGQFVLRREIGMTVFGMRIDYAARSLRGEIPFLWMAHPQFRAPAGTVVRFSPHQDGWVEAFGPHPGESVSRGLPANPVECVAAGSGRKFWTRSGAAPRSMTIDHPNNASLTMTWEGPISDFALWIDNGWKASEPIVCPEPSTSFGDDVDVAAAAGRALVLTEHEWTRWQVQVDVRCLSDGLARG